MIRALFALALGLVISTQATPAAAQSRFDVRIGFVSSKEKCQYFREYEGKSALVASPWMLAYAREWRSWLVKDCEQQFQGMRDTLEGALASTRRLSVGNGGYTVSVTLSGVTEGQPVGTPPVSDPNGYAVSQSWIAVAADVLVQDKSGRTIFGGPIFKKVELSSSISTDDFSQRSAMNGEALYGKLQQEVAMAVARKVAFELDPLRVLVSEGDTVKLNYGSPVLTLGSLVEIDVEGSLRRIKFRVVSAGADDAIAEVDGDQDTRGILAGAKAYFIEADDPAAGGRRYKRTKLP